MDPSASLIPQIIGPVGALVLACLILYGFYSRKIRPGQDVEDCRDDLKQTQAIYATIVPALKNFSEGSEAVVTAVSGLDGEVEGFSARLDALEQQHAAQIESLKAHYKIEMDAMRSEIRELVRTIGQMNGDVRVVSAAIERIDKRGVGPWRGGTS